MLTSDQLHRILVAVPTPVRGDDSIDTPATRALFDWMLPRGINGVLAVGGTGEYGALSRAQRARFARLSVEAMSGRGPVLAGVLDTGFHDALEAGKAFATEGVDALLVVTPYYTNPTQTGVRDYFLRYADQSPVPILIYEIPYRTRIAIEPKVMHDLSRHERIIGMKACNTDMYHFLQVTAGVDPAFAVLSGEDTLFPLHMAAGACGGIIVTACLFPKLWLRLFDIARKGDAAGALSLHRQLIPLLNMAFAETNPGPIKAIWDLIGVHAPRLLAPLVDCAPALAADFRAAASRQIAESETP